MRSESSSVAGWLVPARRTCSRKLSSPSASIVQTSTPACAKASDRHSPTGPAPTTITRSDSLCMIARAFSFVLDAESRRALGLLPLPLVVLGVVTARDRGCLLALYN